MCGPKFCSMEITQQIRDYAIESRLADGVAERLAECGIGLADLGPYNYHTGSMQIVWRDEEGRLHGSTRRPQARPHRRSRLSREWEQPPLRDTENATVT
jgi:hypothetical protein